MTSTTPSETPLLRPAEAAQRLGIPASTLRRWSRRFASFLSPDANGLREGEDKRGHRRYTPQDMAVLARCKDLLSQGLTFDQVAQRLAETHAPDVTLIQGQVEDVPQVEIIEPAPAEPVLPEPPADPGHMLAQMLNTISSSQQMILTGQRSERELLQLVIQDNLNLKAENQRLRERMVETERRIFEMKREMERYRDEERERMRQMEAYMFQLQRQLDDLARNQRAILPGQILVPAVPAAQPGPHPPAPASAPTTAQPPTPATSAPASSPSPPQEPPATNGTSPKSETPTSSPRKRSFWDWLLGR